MIKFDASSLTAAITGMTRNVREAVDEESLRSAGYAGAKVFQNEAKRNALRNKRTGVLRNNIIVKRLEEESTPTKQAYLVTVRSGKFGAEGDAFYWRWVENGHSYVRRRKSKRDSITKRRAEALEFGTSRTPAYPFLRPAYESKKQEAPDAAKARLAARINEKLKK